MPRAKHSPSVPDSEDTVKQHYNVLYAQLCMQAQHKYFSGKTLSGRGMCLRRDLMNTSVVPAQHALIMHSCATG